MNLEILGNALFLLIGFVVGAAMVAVGIVLAVRTRRKAWHVMTGVGAVLVLGCIAMVVCALLLVDGVAAMPNVRAEIEKPEELIGADWRTWRAYSTDYDLGMGVKVCFASLDEGGGYAVYDATDGVRIASLSVEGADPTQAEPIRLREGNGPYRDVGVVLNNGDIQWFRYDPELLGSWPDHMLGCFTYLMEDDTQQLRWGYEQPEPEGLTERQYALYEEMLPKVLALEDFSYVAARVGYPVLDDALMAWGEIQRTHPQTNNYFMLQEVNNAKGEVVSLDAHYYCIWRLDGAQDKALVRKGISEFETCCDEIVAGMDPDAAVCQQYLYLAQELAERTEYDDEMSNPGAATPYGALLGGRSICQGYAEAYRYLCQKADLWCREVTGEAGGEAHVWNLVMLPEGSFHVDVTWADESGLPGEPGFMGYMFLSQEEILADHEVTDGTVATGLPLFQKS